MSLQDIRDWIRDQVREQHATNGGEVSTKGIAKHAAYLVAEDTEAQDTVNETWALAQAQREVRNVRGGSSVRSLLVPDGAGTYVRAGQLTLFSLREFASRQRVTGQTIAQLASQVIAIVDAALKAGADPQQRPEDVMTTQELEAVYRLQREAQSAA